MFIDDQFKNKQKSSEESGDKGVKIVSPSHHTRNIALFIGFCVILTFLILGIFFGGKIISYYQDDNGENGGQENPVSTSSPFGGGKLPTGGEVPGNGGEKATTTLEGENLFFGDFYQKPEFDFEPSLASYELPLNVKTDVANYYELNRKIDLENQIENLNQNGFAIVPNGFIGANNFFDSYRKLESEGIPTLITKEFLNYYYQNVLKSNYREIEKNIFYENLWNISLKFYNRARDRYEKLLNLKGLTNDPLLEASRREAAYFAVALKLLEPNTDQINQKKINDEDKFSTKEAGDYYVDLPVYLQDDVNPEVSLIEEKKKTADKLKSPVLLYQRDYSYFNTPQGYNENARLHNVYLTLRWFNSRFPLFPRSESCPDCYLDKADWRINNLTALLISEDFSQNQILKNEWAQIYKTLSFFQGLRDELTYLDYNRSLVEVLGEEYDLKEEFWDKSLETVDQGLEEVRKDIASKLRYTDIEGSFQNTTSSRPHIGMRFLSEPFFPNKYVYQSLTYPQVGKYLSKNRHILSRCRSGKIGDSRCFAIDLDIVNLIRPLKNKNEIFDANRVYKKYEEQVEKIKRQIDRFDRYTWHKNNYWSTYYLLDKSMGSLRDSNPAYTRSADWLDRNTILISGSLANLQTEPDKLKIYQKNDSPGGLGGLEKRNLIKQSREFNYIEPNLTFIKEMKANAQMVLDMLSSLQVVDRLYSLKTNLTEFIKNLEKMEEIVKKELSGEDLTEKDHEFISSFSGHYEVDLEREKTLTHKKAITESIEGVKILILVYERQDGKKVFTAGPIFDYKRHEK